MREFKVGDVVTVSDERYQSALTTFCPTVWDARAKLFYGKRMIVSELGYKSIECEGYDYRWSDTSLTHHIEPPLLDEDLFTL